MSLASQLTHHEIVGRRLEAVRDWDYWFSLLITALAFLAVMGAGAAANASQETHKVRLLGFSTSPSGVAFQVPTGGCLAKDDFSVRINREGNGPALLQLVTDKTDQCRVAVPYGKIIRFTYDELGVQVGESFVITNTSGVVNRAGFAEIFEPASE